MVETSEMTMRSRKTMMDPEKKEEEHIEEEEPVLKYERLGRAAAEILEKDTASAIAVGETVSPYYRLPFL
jgi:hypothetical protein